MTDTLLTLFVVVTGDPDDDDWEICGPFKTERAARDVAAACSCGEEEGWAVALEAPEQGFELKWQRGCVSRLSRRALRI